MLGYDLQRLYEPGEACVIRLIEIRAALPKLDPEARQFLSFAFEHLAASKAQMLQDLFALHETGMKRGGYFVEFGAADGVRGSNSYLLESEFGWTGIVAEAARCWHSSLDSNRRCAVDHRCVADRTGDTLLFRECREPEVSTIDSCAGNDRFARVRRARARYPVTTVSLNDLLVEHGAPRGFDYLSVDTEGSELMILAAFDFGAWRPRVITVEHCHSPAREKLFDLLSSHGYRRKFEQLSQIEDWYVLA